MCAFLYVDTLVLSTEMNRSQMHTFLSLISQKIPVSASYFKLVPGIVAWRLALHNSFFNRRARKHLQ